MQDHYQETKRKIGRLNLSMTHVKLLYLIFLQKVSNWQIIKYQTLAKQASQVFMTICRSEESTVMDTCKCEG